MSEKPQPPQGADHARMSYKGEWFEYPHEALWARYWHDLAVWGEDRIRELEADLADSRLIAREQEDAHVAANMRATALEADRDRIELTLAIAKADRDKWFNKARDLENALHGVIKEFASSSGEQMTTAQRDALRTAKALTAPETVCNHEHITGGAGGMRWCDDCGGALPKETPAEPRMFTGERYGYCLYCNKTFGEHGPLGICIVKTKGEPDVHG